MDKEELLELFDTFLNESGQYWKFKAWVESQGYTMQELGFHDEE